MTAIESTQQTTANQSVTQKSTTTTPSDTGNEFDDALKGFISPAKADQVSEEDLFAGLIQERLKKTKDDQTLASFQEFFSEAKTSLTKSDGYVPVEDAAKQALVSLRDSGALSEDETNQIYSQSFAAAQLDTNTDALYDGRGGENDPTIAIATLEQALLGSRVKMESFDAGTEVAPTRSVTEASIGKSLTNAPGSTTGSAGFLFKPVSDSDGKLAVLLPPTLSGMVDSLRLVGPDGTTLETGRYGGNGNGGREHFRFSRAGGEYPDGLTVEATLKSGEVVKYRISDTSQRTDDPGSESSESAAPQTSEANDLSKGSNSTTADPKSSSSELAL